MTETLVLLVEDEPSYARLLKEILLGAAGLPHRLVSVTSLEAALDELARTTFDIVLLDLGLPDAQGTEALERVTTASPTTPIVVLSGFGDLEFAIESMRMGAQEYLVKGQSEDLLLPRAIRYAIERKRLQLEAERASRVKDEFLAMLGHELRNPLAPIVTGLALIRRHRDPAIDHELTVVERQVQHVVHLVDDLLDVSRVVRGKMELRRETVDMADIVADGIEAAQPLFDERRHRIKDDVQRGTAFVRGDRSRLVQVAANLFTNAAKYTDPGGSIEISTRTDGEWVELHVGDDGIGMTSELVERVFGLFEQGPRTVERGPGGLGLGLAIVDSIVKMHNGTVTARSGGPGKGSEFIVRLPARPADLAPSLPPPSAPPSSQQTPRRILVVDDNTDGAELLALALGQQGHEVRVAHDGPSALVLTQSFVPELALLDIGLPGMDGHELAVRLREQLKSDTPTLVAMTGYGDQSFRARSRDAGFSEHLVKPVDLARIDRLLASLPTRPGA